MSVDTERGLLLVLLLNTAHLSAGVVSDVFSTVGGSVTLPCRGVIRTDCSTTTWVFSSISQRTAVELVSLGRIGDQKPGRVSLGSDCSLHVHTLSTQDAGLYVCQQFVNDQQQGEDSHVSLSLLTNGSGARPTPQKPGRTETSPAGKTPVTPVVTQSEPGSEGTAVQTHAVAAVSGVCVLVLLVSAVGVVIYTRRTKRQRDIPGTENRAHKDNEADRGKLHKANMEEHYMSVTFSPTTDNSSEGKPKDKSSAGETNVIYSTVKHT